MPLWLPVSALFPVFLVGTLIKAFLHFRRTRASGEYAPGRAHAGRIPADDWIPSR